jgi:hypothetical protein
LQECNALKRLYLIVNEPEFAAQPDESDQATIFYLASGTSPTLASLPLFPKFIQLNPITWRALVSPEIPAVTSASTGSNSSRRW